MPQIEEGKNYNWQISGNAAMAGLVRSFYHGITVADSASIDSLENAYNQNTHCSAEVFARSQSFGRSIATAVYNWYLTDNINLSNVGYVLPCVSGCMGANTSGLCKSACYSISRRCAHLPLR
jgi:hypothetical protein